MSKIYLVIKSEGEWEDYRTTPIEAWLSKEKAEKALEEYTRDKEVLPAEDWGRLCEEVDTYEEKMDLEFSNYTEGILFLHQCWDTSEFRDKLVASEELYESFWGKPDYYLETIELKG